MKTTAAILTPDSNFCFRKKEYRCKKSNNQAITPPSYKKKEPTRPEE